ncbi:MAG: hypothetical protein K2N48_01175 [Muribaculaceae bacterium]|nr:hypothetical protein [Muribaculaceae bacterium]
MEENFRPINRIRIKKVVISGSMKFWDEIQKAASRESMSGNIVLVPWKHPDDIELTDEQRLIYNEEHYQRIDMADEMLVVNPNGYIGQSTTNEITYAVKRGIPIRYTDIFVATPTKEVIGRSIVTEEFVQKIYDRIDEFLRENPFISIVTLIGSGRHADLFRVIKNDLTRRGVMVLTPAIFNFHDPSKLTADEHLYLDSIHRMKMAFSDHILVVNPDGHIGQNTADEIKWAEDHHKPISYMRETGSSQEVNNGNES